jgi:dUTP pyrophosphatase
MGETVMTRFGRSSMLITLLSDSMKVRIKRLREDAYLPAYAHSPSDDAGLDLRAVEETTLDPGVPQLVPTGLAIELPSGCEAQIRPRSGLALNHAITLPNSPATIDPGYRGEIRVILLNLGKDHYVVHRGDRIAQMIVARYETVEWEEGELGNSGRGTGGFGSSGR